MRRLRGLRRGAGAAAAMRGVRFGGWILSRTSILRTVAVRSIRRRCSRAALNFFFVFVGHRLDRTRGWVGAAPHKTIPENDHESQYTEVMEDHHEFRRVGARREVSVAHRRRGRRSSTVWISHARTVVGRTAEVHGVHEPRVKRKVFVVLAMHEGVHEGKRGHDAESLPKGFDDLVRRRCGGHVDFFPLIFCRPHPAAEEDPINDK